MTPGTRSKIAVRRLRALALALLANACGARPGAGSGAPVVVVEVPSASESVSSSPRPIAARELPCNERALISHAETSDDRLNARAGFTGHWFTYADGNGSHVVPWPPNLPGGGFSMSPGGYRSPFAAHMLGELVKGDTVFAGMGADFFEPPTGYDARAFSGVEFWAKADPDSNPPLRLLLADQAPSANGPCSECFDYFGAELELSGDWRLQRVAFASLAFVPEWSASLRAGLVRQRIDVSALFGFQLRVSEPGAAFDVWVDDVKLTGCPP